MGIKQILKHARSSRTAGQNYVAMIHRLAYKHLAEALELASYESHDLVFPGALSVEAGLPVHVVPVDCEIVKIQAHAATPGAGTDTVKLMVGGDDLCAAMTLAAGTQTGVLARTALAAGDIVKLVSTGGAASDVVVTLTIKRLHNRT